jgi:hypothetical protein
VRLFLSMRLVGAVSCPRYVAFRGKLVSRLAATEDVANVFQLPIAVSLLSSMRKLET